MQNDDDYEGGNDDRGDTGDDGGFDDDGDLLRGSVYRQQVIWQILPLDGAVDSHLPRYWRIKIQNTTLSDILD